MSVSREHVVSLENNADSVAGASLVVRGLMTPIRADVLTDVCALDELEFPLRNGGKEIVTMGGVNG